MADYGICRAEGCDKPACQRGLALCAMHTARMKRGGTLERRVEKKTISELLGAERFGLWDVLGEGESYIRPGNNAPMRTATCRCECGVVRDVAAHTLKLGTSRHCGCGVSALTTKMKTIHGMSKTPEWRAWCSLKDRCLNANNEDYRHYGGRGITVCGRWRDSFEDFFADMGLKPSAAHSIDRIDVNGNYEPGNCRWATGKQQARNKRVQRFVEHQGRKMTLTEACEIVGINMKFVHGRMRKGMSFHEAVNTPIMTAKEASRLGIAAKVAKYGHA